jgi:hypothetical protein
MIGRRAFLATAAAAAAAGRSAAETVEAPEPPAPLIYYAGEAGRLTTDRDRLGGNPFASALVEVLQDRELTLEEFGRRLAVATARHSGGWQRPDFPKRVPSPGWPIAEARGERRLALALVSADYSKAGAPSLPGAALDARRVPEALGQAGFETETVFDGTRETVMAALADFARRSQFADAALIYVGGHGLQHGRTVYWLLADQPLPTSAVDLGRSAMAIPAIAASARARAVNLILYAACRNAPFAGQRSETPNG